MYDGDTMGVQWMKWKRKFSSVYKCLQTSCVCVCVCTEAGHKHEYIIIISLIIYDFHMRYKMIHNQSTLLLLLLNIRIERGVVAAKKDRILLYDIETRNHYVFLNCFIHVYS